MRGALLLKMALLTCESRSCKVFTCLRNFNKNVRTLYTSEQNVNSNSTKNEFFQEKQILYPEHIETSLLQKMLLTAGSATMALADPYRDDMVAVLGETTGHSALQKIHKRMINDPEGASILRDKPRINSQTVNLDYLQNLPEETFGYSYASFLNRNKVSPDTRQPVHFVDDVELAYVMQRYREVHDLVHALLNMPTNMVGEVVVKWIEAVQTGLPMCIAGALFGPLRFTSRQRQIYHKKYLPWAIKCALKANFLMNVYYENRWEQSLESLHKELNIEQIDL